MMFRQTDDTYVRNNVWSYDSDWNGSSYFQIRGATDVGAVCNKVYLTNNTIFSERPGVEPFVDIADTNNDVKVTNNLVIANIEHFIDDLTPSSVGTGNIVENNRVTGLSGNWLDTNVPSYGWTQQNNITGQSPVWIGSGNKPTPYWDLTQSLDGGNYPWNPSDDYNHVMRKATPDVGAFEYEYDLTPPALPKNLTIKINQ
jgi:hypothetical protein